MEEVTSIAATTYDTVYNEGSPNSFHDQLDNIIKRLNTLIEQDGSKKNGNTPKPDINETINSFEKSIDKLSQTEETSEQQMTGVNEASTILNNETTKLNNSTDELSKQLIETEKLASSSTLTINQSAANTRTVQGSEQPIPIRASSSSAPSKEQQYSEIFSNPAAIAPSLQSMVQSAASNPQLQSMAISAAQSEAKSAFGNRDIGRYAQYAQSALSNPSVQSMAQSFSQSGNPLLTTGQTGGSRKKRTYYKKTRKRNC